MKKLFLLLILTLIFIGTLKSFAYQSPFSKALRTCQNYSQNGSIFHQGMKFDIMVALEKNKNSCVYKEKIYQNDKYQMLTCQFPPDSLTFMADSMERFYSAFPKEFEKNKIFEAKMTTNGEIFKKYLADPKYCKITYTKK